jgi:hypothetical protein
MPVAVPFTATVNKLHFTWGLSDRRHRIKRSLQTTGVGPLNLDVEAHVKEIIK